MSKTRDELDRRLRSLALGTYFAAEAEQSDELRKRADVLMAALEPDFCEEVASKAATHAHTMSEGFGAKKNREGARMVQAVQSKLDDPGWRVDYEKGGIGAQQRRLAQGIADDLYRVLLNCPLARELLPHLRPDDQEFFLEGRVTGRIAIHLTDRDDPDDLHPTERVAKAVEETLKHDERGAKSIVVAALKSLGCADYKARGFVPRQG